MASRVCWKCGKDAHMAMQDYPKASEHFGVWTAAYVCDHCNVFSIAQIDNEESYTSEFKVAKAMESPGASLSWFPVMPLGKDFPEVPVNIASAASEAFACYSIRSYRGAVMLARAVVEAIAKDKGATKGSLKEKIDRLGEESAVSPLIVQTAHEIRLFGNEMAHGDFVTEITEEECADTLTFMTELIEEVYQRPAHLLRFRQQRLARKQLPESSE